jgi:hypothetical protein
VKNHKPLQKAILGANERLDAKGPRLHSLIEAKTVKRREGEPLSSREKVM